MNCQEFADEILLHAAGALEPEEVEPLLEHLAGGCPRCAGRLTEAKSLLGLLVLTLPPATPSQQSRQELLKRLATPTKLMTPPPAMIPPTAEPASVPQMRLVGSSLPSWWAQILMPSAIAASIAAIITIVFALRLAKSQTADSLDSTQKLQQTLAVMTGVVEQQQQQIINLKKASNGTQMVEMLADPHVRTFALAGTSNQPADASGRIYWDTDKSIWCLYAHGMRPAPEGKTYELWYVSSDGKTALPAGSFDPSPDGDATMVSNVPALIAPHLTIGAVTDEPAGEKITAPSGTFQLKGVLQQ